MKQAAFVAILTSYAVFGQQAGKPPAFEVASVRPSSPGEGGPGDVPRNMSASPGQFAMRNVALRFAIEWAYDLKDYEVSGPDRIKGEQRYDITAKAAGPASDEQMKPMLRTLLMERFQMKLHREKKELPVYALLPGKGAAKVRVPGADEKTGLSGSSTGAVFTKQPISRLTFLLTRRMDRPVLDLTGLNGVYDYNLDLSGLNNGADHPEAPAELSIFTSVRENLGLKLEARKQVIEVLVIDSLNKLPTEN